MTMVIDAWNRFFFKPTPAHTLGLFRICYGLIVFLAVLGLFPYRETFLGENAIVMPLVMQKFFEGRWMLLGFSFLPTRDPGMALFLLAVLVSAAMLCVGLCSRLASVLVFIGIYSIHNRNFFITNAGDLLMRIDSLILIFADCGAALSVDRWIRVRRKLEGPTPRLVSPWPVRLIQLQLSYLYCQTALLKMHGASWREGTALYYALRYLELQRFRFTFLFHYLWQIKMMTWGVMLGESLVGTLIWVRRLRYPLLLLGLSLHEGINLTMQFPVFQYVMMVNLIAFVIPEDLERWIARLRRGRASTEMLSAEARPDLKLSA